MRIGIDVDGVLIDQEKYQLENGKKYFKNVKDIDETGYDIEDIFHCSHSEREKFWLKYIWKYCISEPISDNAASIISRLKAEGHEIHIITGRAHTTETGITGKLFRKMLEKWLEKNNVVYDSITYCSEKESANDKVEACQKLGIEVMLDDKKENINALKDSMPVICFDAMHNQDVEGFNVFRVKNFNEAYECIEEISKSKKDNEVFKTLSQQELEKLSDEEKEVYYSKMREFYQKLPYDAKKYKKQENNYSMVSNLFIPLFNVIFKPTVFNKELIPDDENVIFVSNHLNYYDQFQIISAIGTRPIHFLTSTKMLALKRGIFYKMTGAISIDRESADSRKESKEEIIKILLNNGNVFIFPEGRTNREKKFIQDFKPGAVSIARTTGKKIVPIAINDNYKRADGPLCVRFGNPIKINSDDDVIEKTEELQDIIKGMIYDNMEYVYNYQKKKEK